MQRYLIPLLLLLGAFLPAAAHAQSETAWWQAEWQYRKPITLDAGTGGAGIAGPVGRAPVLVRLHAGNFAFDGVNADGSDLRFVGADGRTVLNHQVEQFDADLGLALVWVDVPQLGGAAQTVWMYYGNAVAPAAGNGQLAFDPDYALVYHFAEDGAPRDTTAYGNHARDARERAEGAAIGRGLRLQGEGVAIPASPSLAVAAGGALTVSAWVRPEAAGPEQTLFARRGGGAFVLGLDGGLPFVQVGEARAVAQRAIAPEGWSHLAVVAGDGQVALYVDGAESARLEAALPALDGDAWIGVDAPAVPVDAATADAGAAAAVRGNPFVGAIDELRVSRIARPQAAIQADVASQGPESRLVAFGEDEQSAGVSHFGYILQAMPVDAWVVVAVLALMLLASWAIMIAKSRYYGAIAKANAAFARHYHEAAGAPLGALGELAEQGRIGRDVQDTSTLWRLYRIALDEVRGRQSRVGAGGRLGAASIAAIRASMDAEVVRESERMSRRMNWLSTTIEGAPYIGLFGTVIGIMLVFAVAAMAGAVDINSVAPGMAAALLCTAAGLGVAIPALFGYNWLVARSEAIAADMAVFVDEFTARLAEEYDEAPAPFAPAAAVQV
ncbi:DUF2341 domain-containing protein [Luteimonas sp. Y-2-2-4F]|nr:DUF2341 domain-containing protein [Luteimonas sp. Y-2-2-4F]MCD9030841.1 DUF2341 domain-containing protein [Luteimonas sp. Y-2-2-4F]